MITDIIEEINLLNKSDFDNKEAIGILLIKELKEINYKSK